MSKTKRALGSYHCFFLDSSTHVDAVLSTTQKNTYSHFELTLGLNVFLRVLSTLQINTGLSLDLTIVWRLELDGIYLHVNPQRRYRP